MGHTLHEFATTCHRILGREPGPEGRKQVCAALQDVLTDPAFVEKHLGKDVSDRQILYEDAELGFCILGHNYEGTKDSNPHDHGPSWAIYGQARGETIMTDWALVEKAGDGKRGKVRYIRSYTLKPGMACVYNEGDLHSPRREGSTSLIRIEGRNLDHVRRFGYDKVD